MLEINYYGLSVPDKMKQPLGWCNSRHSIFAIEFSLNILLFQSEFYNFLLHFALYENSRVLHQIQYFSG